MQDCISLKLEVQYCDHDENHANILGAVNIVNHIIYLNDGHPMTFYMLMKCTGHGIMGSPEPN